VSSGKRTLVRNVFQKPVTYEGIQNGDTYQVSKGVLKLSRRVEGENIWAYWLEGRRDESWICAVKSEQDDRGGEVWMG